MRAALVRTPVTFQTLFQGSFRYTSFLANSKKAQQKLDAIPTTLDTDRNTTSNGTTHPTNQGLQGLIELQLSQQAGEDIDVAKASQDDTLINLSSKDPRHQSQWLQITEWPCFLEPHKHELQQVGALKSLPNPDKRHELDGFDDSDALLPILITSLDRVIVRARTSLKEGRLNAFDQHRLNSFIAGRSSQKPLIHNLRDETYKKYTRVLQHLMCYVYRLAWRKIGPRLYYRLTEGQAIAMVEAVRTATELAQSDEEEFRVDHLDEIKKRLDDKCLVFIVSLLDHKLYGEIYDSIVVGFLAAMGIQPGNTKGN